ncbi:flagellar assembly protein FliW [Oceanobacillus sp. J11TS1]|uniref:flagellar assembly protein FliW n=1 Tax=Oceanobacillus sp. J11TS1 TaxID=2807191 RepID=UPI001B004DD6|nr:flagellar assembly protein FliW [Oceanobacillus sp. J11TS1]GIO23874.1 flagellar assembly factor FliW [Oceanobacillus sp. J11TS1]
MKVRSTYLGEIAIDESKIIHFPSGIPGFSESKQFVLLELPDNQIFHILQSVDDEKLAFIITDPYHFYQNYSFELEPSILEYLKIKDRNDIAVYTIVTVQKPFTASTINLKAPIIIHMKGNLAKQIVLQNEAYSSRVPISQPLREKGEK